MSARLSILVVAMLLEACPLERGSLGEGEGEGDTGPGVLEASVPSCALGTHSVASSVAPCEVVLRNRGTGPLTLTAADAPAQIHVDGLSGQTILPGGVDLARVQVVLSPVTPALIDDVVTFRADNAEPLSLPVTATVLGCPRAVIQVRRDTVDVTAEVVPALPPDTIVLDASASTPSTPSGTVVAYAWEIVSRGVGSAAVLSSPFAAVTNLDERRVGSIVVRLTVFDDVGAQSCNAASVTVDTKPRLSVAVADALVAGLEAHVFRDPAERCTSLDCFGASCGLLASSPPEWDGATGRSLGDPVSDEGGGVVVGSPVDGTYTVGVLARQAATGDVTLVVDLDEVVTESRPLDADAFWTVATVTFSNGIASVSALDDVEAGVTCP
jgi:hypothetical protein